MRILGLQDPKIKSVNRHAEAIAPQPAKMASRWTDERVKAIVTAEFVCSKLRQEERLKLAETIELGEGPAVTYLEWILHKAKRMFLILVQIGCPYNIFVIIDEAYDDDDLPLTADDIANLNLSMEKTLMYGEFSRAQFQFLTKEVTCPAQAEEIVEKKLALEVVSAPKSRLATPNSAEVTDTVRFAGDKSKVYTRQRIVFRQGPQYFQEEDFVQDVEIIKKISHSHLISLRASYTGVGCGYVLLTPTIETSLKSFFSDMPKHFKSLPARKQLDTLMNWPHCLASALSFLHEQGVPHGKIRPSNIVVDSSNRIVLGFTIVTRTLQIKKKENELEAYDYGPPEQWTRAAIAQSHQPVMMPQPQYFVPRPDMTSWNSADSRSSRSGSDSTSSSTFKARSEITGSFSYFADAINRNSIDLGARSQMSPSAGMSPIVGGYTPPYSVSDPNMMRAKPPGLPSYNSPPFAPPPLPDHTQFAYAVPDQLHSGLGMAPPDTEIAIVTVNKPQAVEIHYGDIFSLACVSLDILTCIVKGRLSAFVSHRSKKNRAVGLGGGPADASFHSNLAAVSTWIDTLNKTARSKSDPLFRGIAPHLLLVRRMLAVDPEARPSALEVVRRMEDALIQGAQFPYLHCGGGGQC